MGINSERYWGPGTKQDAGSVAINASVGFFLIYQMLQDIRNGKPVDPEMLEKLKEVSDKLEEHWDQLAGWSKD